MAKIYHVTLTCDGVCSYGFCGDIGGVWNRAAEYALGLGGMVAGERCDPPVEEEN